MELWISVKLKTLVRGVCIELLHFVIMGEQAPLFAHNPEAVGSNPAPATNNFRSGFGLIFLSVKPTRLF